MNYIVKQFLRDCDEQIEYTSYLEMLPEEIINLIYRFVNDANNKKLSDPFRVKAIWTQGLSRFYHNNGFTYKVEKEGGFGGLVSTYGKHGHHQFSTPLNYNLPNMSLGDLKDDCKTRQAGRGEIRHLPKTITHKNMTFRLRETDYRRYGTGVSQFMLKYYNNKSMIRFIIVSGTKNTYKTKPVPLPLPNTDCNACDFKCEIIADQSARMLFRD